MSHKYGTKSRRPRGAAISSGVAAAIASIAAAQSSAPHAPTSVQATHKCVVDSPIAMDGWDDQLLTLFDFICHLLGCPNGSQIVAEPDLIESAEAFLAMTDPFELSPDVTLAELEAGFDHAEAARWANGTQPLLPPYLAQAVDQRLVVIQQSLSEAIEQELEAQTPW